MKLWKFLGIAGAVLTVGAGVFFFTRPAAAAAAGRKAFKVDAKCENVEIVDEEAAKEALTAAAMVHFQGLSQKAIDLIVLALGQAMPQCPINDYLKITGIPGVPFGITIGQIRAIVGDMTLEQVQEMAAKGELPGIPGMVGSSGSEELPNQPGYGQAHNGGGLRNPVAAILAWTTGGDYP